MENIDSDVSEFLRSLGMSEYDNWNLMAGDSEGSGDGHRMPNSTWTPPSSGLRSTPSYPHMSSPAARPPFPQHHPHFPTHMQQGPLVSSSTPSYPYAPPQSVHASVGHMYPPQPPGLHSLLVPPQVYVPPPTVHTPIGQAYPHPTGHVSPLFSGVPAPYVLVEQPSVQNTLFTAGFGTGDPVAFSSSSADHCFQLAAGSEKTSESSNPTSLRYYFDNGYYNWHKIIKLSHQHAYDDLIKHVLLDVTDDWAQEMLERAMGEFCTSPSRAPEPG